VQHVKLEGAKTSFVWLDVSGLSSLNYCFSPHCFALFLSSSRLVLGAWVGSVSCFSFGRDPDSFLFLSRWVIWIQGAWFLNLISCIDVVVGFVMELLYEWGDSMYFVGKSVTLMCCILRVFCFAWKLLAELNVVWGFPYLGTRWRLFRLCEAMERGPLRLCEPVVEELFECCTVSLVWSSGEGIDVSPYFGSLWV